MARPVSMETASDPDGRPVLRLQGRFDAAGAGAVWRDALRWARSRSGEAAGGERVLDGSGIEYCNGAGASLLLAVRDEVMRGGAALRFEGLSDATTRLVESLAPGEDTATSDRESGPGWVEGLGEATLELMADLRAQVAFVGEFAWMLGAAVLRPARVRWSDFFRVAHSAGIGALPIITLVGFLLGLILSFQSVIPMQRFGAEIFVADLLGLSMFRELGPLMTAILLTARSGSAFAAEIGTMKVNEEIDALTTMGLEPVRFLVVPRVLAVILVVPVLTLWMNLAGLVGGALVFRSLEYPLVTFVTRVADFAGVVDLVGGLGKSFVLGLIVAAVGCQRGLAAGSGSEAVGAATTSSVVSGIVLIALAEGVFAVIFYAMGW
ncbi:MAG: ABC transporter permease [Myxococcota bacterium]|nr:ABC transporter permease [Myxococcota bacterium]